MTNILTVDLEEWYVVEALRDRQSTEDWSRFQSAAFANSRRLLALLECRSIRATWFVLGYVAERISLIGETHVVHLIKPPLSNCGTAEYMVVRKVNFTALRARL